MLIGYVRVSKSGGTQTLAPQRDAMLAAGVDPTRIYEDLASGRRDDGPGLAACLKAIQPGNTLVLWKLDRLGRDLRHLVNTVEDLRTWEVGLKVLAGAGAQIDTTTANGRLAFGIFAEFERKKGRHLSTVRTLQLLVEPGVDTPGGFQRLVPGRLTASTLNRHLKRLGYDQERMTRQPPAGRFQAERSNALWRFDMSPSDLKHLKAPPWLDPDRAGAPTLILFSAADDRSGVAYQEHRCVYGEDVEAALRFLFNAMSPKPAAAGGDDGDPFQGIPAMIYLHNGPVAKSAVFKRVVESLGAGVMTHMPAGSDGRRTTARSKGKVGRPFRTIKDAHETLYHFHEPQTEAEANQWRAPV